MGQQNAGSGKPEAAHKGLETALKQTSARKDWLKDELAPIPLQRMPQFDSLRSEPRFQAIVKQLEQRQADIRAQVLPVLCKWHYAPDGWHPPASTCTDSKRVTASSKAPQTEQINIR